MHIAHRLFPAALAFAGLAGASVAQEQAGFPPPERVQGSVSYVSGGIGSDEAATLREAAAAYPLTLEFTAPSGGLRGEYVSDAKVEIRDRQGRPVLSTTAEGPLVLVRLPSGTYAVEVAWNGAVKRKTVAITSGKRLHVVFEFPPDNAPR
ncbi:MAG TPA: carboxypeptidase regulatory-like domain-containing protein [Casimicrobiaceae bacterium]|jgi:hypothetical protein|nr:carboxypeptidase regulatory-like domain-containing protein [Casimicrobiaceae bacterium]